MSDKEENDSRARTRATLLYGKHFPVSCTASAITLCYIIVLRGLSVLVKENTGELLQTCSFKIM